MKKPYDDEIEIIEPHLPEDFKLILNQLEKVIEIYHEMIMVWARPAIYVNPKHVEKELKK